MELKDMIEEAFSGYAAMTIQQRAIVDARDFVKPSARMCFYAQKLAKIDSKHPIQPSPTSVGESLKNFYLHGDASCYGLLARYGKEYVMRYPLEDFHGSTGSLMSANSEAAARYTKMRLNSLGDSLFETINKNTINIWFENFSNTKKYPSVLPSLGFYNIVNGTLGIATGLSTNVPQFCLTEVNEAMIKLLHNPDIDFDEIYCPPDFISGATILNGNEVKESLRVGKGKSCCIRSTIEYNEKEKCLIVTEIPYGVFTNTICQEIQEKVNNEELLGIEKVLDLTKKTPNIKIYLTKTCNVEKLIRELYKKTSLQSYYGINLTLLDHGTTPKIFSWREALLAHIEHEKEVRTKAHIFDREVAQKRLHIIEGFFIAIANIDEVVNLIKSSKNKEMAKNSLIKRFNFSEEQVDAVLKLTLARLTNLEIESFQKEKENLIAEISYHNNVLSKKELLDQEIEKGFRDVIEKYGDSRKTKVINLDFSKEDEDEPIEKKELLIHYTNLGNIYTQETSTLLLSKRGRAGTKIKMKENEVIEKTIRENNFSRFLIFTNFGKMYSLPTSNLPINSKINVKQFLSFEPNEIITAVSSVSKSDSSKFLVFVTKNGYIKKTEISQYKITKSNGTKAINLKDNDEVVDVLAVDNETIGILTKNNIFLRISTDDISPIGRVALGVKGIKLKEDDYVIKAKTITSKDEYILSISKNGIVKKTSIKEFPIASRNTNGRTIAKVAEEDIITDFVPADHTNNIAIITKKKNIKIKIDEVKETSRQTIGVKGVTLTDDTCVSILKE